MPAAAKKKRFKSFGVPENLNPDPITFEIYGEEFTAYPEIQGSHLLQFSKEVGSEDNAEVTGALLNFFKTVLYEESYERMETLWNDKERIVPIDVISDIVAFLIEEYTDRPTRASEEP